jgi:pSer/pThr/pTyr-binding forkhead associated (FHA) protein
LVEVPDRRVSRLHCTLTLQQDALPAGLGSKPSVQLQDLSSNGTFLNGRKMAPGSTVTLAEGDVISLVLSVAPFAEVSYTLRLGTVGQHELSSHHPTSNSAVARTTTSKYTTAAEASLEDLECPICHDLLEKAIALEPCGHSFCATCLAQYLGSQLDARAGKPTCPFR